MSGTKKARGDSRLKTLPPERQEAIAEYSAGHTLVETVGWLKADGLATSSAALSEFLSWWRLGKQLERNQGTVDRLLNELRQATPGIEEDKLQRAGQLFFSALAIEKGDSLIWSRVQDAAVRREMASQGRIKLQRETCELFLKWIADRRAKEITESGATNAEKIERLGELMFGEDWK